MYLHFFIIWKSKEFVIFLKNTNHLLYIYIHTWYFQVLIQFICSVMSDSLWPHGLQHARLPCPSPTPGACSNSRPSTQWCHPTISSSVISSFCLQSFSASGSFSMSQFFTSGGQSIGVLPSASVLPVNIQDWFSLECRQIRELLHSNSID